MKRKSQRLQNHDYSLNRTYFVTICVKHREECFGLIKSGKMILNECGMIVENQWLWLKKYPNVILDNFCIMPNHFHGLITINTNLNQKKSQHDNDITQHDNDVFRRDNNNINFIINNESRHKNKPLPEVIGAFKTTSSKKNHQIGISHFQWQRSYYDHIVRNDWDLIRIRKYITKNPINWDKIKN